MKNDIISSDESKRKNLIYLKLLESVFNSVTDIVKVYDTDYTIVLLNAEGYKLYKKMKSEIIGKKCFDYTLQNGKCAGCPFEKVLINKKDIVLERYIPEFSKYMNVCFTPVLDEEKNVIFVIERLKDITDKKVLEKILRENKERYTQIVNSYPDSLIITEDNKIVLANNEACTLLGIDYNDIIGENIYRFIDKKYTKIIHKRIRKILQYKEMKASFEYEFNCIDAKTRYLQITSSYIIYQGRQAILSVIRDVTDMTKEMKKAGNLMKKTLQKVSPLPEKFEMETVYVPANTLSGDFFRVHIVNDNLVVGIIIDVSGKGVIASLSLSAIEVLFYEEVAISNNPMEIVKNLNRRLINSFGESYIAVSCFSMDFLKHELDVAGAGINEFIYKKRNDVSEVITVQGSFLGMFQNSEFEEKKISFEKGDRFYFFTDGLDFITDNDRVIQHYMEKVSIDTFRNYLEEFLNDTIMEIGTLKDDSTLITFEIR